MKRSDLLIAIAETGYNVYFGAQKHFATYNLVEKFPGWISLISFVIGLYALFVPDLNNNYLSALMICLGVSAMYVSGYNHDKDKYNKCGITLTEYSHKLRALYYECKGKNDTDDISAIETQWKNLQAEVLKIGITKQIFSSNLFAHYYFFWQCQIEWIHEQKKFRLLRDKIPLSFTLAAAIAIGYAIWHFSPNLQSALACLNPTTK